MIRLDKYLAHAKLGTRKEVKKIIRKGFVFVNDEVIKNDDYKVDENNDVVRVENEIINYREFYYILLNKPDGYISSTIDENYPSVLNLIYEDYAYELYPIGRLDVDTHGLLLLSNDGKLSHNLLSPKKHVDKTYYVELAKDINNDDIEKIKAGITYGEDTYLGGDIKVIEPKVIELTIHEGKFHQVKNMMKAIDNEVLYLKRIKMGNLTLDNSLEEGDYRELSEEEIKQLKGES